MVGAIFWNYLSVVFSWIAETISVERWEGTLEYTMMAPIRRWAQLLGSVLYAMVYGLVHTAVILVVLILFFPQLDVHGANPLTVVSFMVLGSFSFVGIGMIAAILPLLYVERGAQMTFVLQSLPVPVCLGGLSLQHAQVEHRFRPGQAGEVPLDRADHHDRVELQSSDPMSREHSDGARVRAGRRVRRTRPLLAGLELPEELFHGAIPGPGHGAGQGQHPLQVPPGIFGIVRTGKS